MTQHTGPSQPAQTPASTFNLLGYLLALGLLTASFAIFFAFTMLAVSSETDRAVAAILFLAFFGLSATVVTLLFKPRHVPKFPIKGEHIVFVTWLAGGGLFLIRLVNRLPTLTEKLDMLLATLIAIACILFIGGMLGKNTRLQKSFKKKASTSGYLLMFVAMLASLIAVQVVMGNEDPIMQRMYTFIVLECFGLLFGALVTLDVINTTSVTESTVPDGHAAIVRAEGRIARIVFEPKVAVDAKKERVKLQDMRMKTATFQINDCETSDHVLVDVKAVIHWQPAKSPEGLMAFHSFSQDPQKAIMELCRSITLAEISRRTSAHISGREEVIAGEVKRRVARQSCTYGISMEQITIVQAKLKFPLPHEGISPLAEASRLQQMDSAIRGVSMTTVQHAEELTRAQASAAIHAGTK